MKKQKAKSLKKKKSRRTSKSAQSTPLVIGRDRPRLQQNLRLLIVCEGDVTEVIYFDGVRRDRGLPKSLVRIVGAGADPKSVVDLAVRLKNENLELNSNDQDQLFDAVWCVFDRDSHTTIPAAKQKAAANQVDVAFSNPNFELFLLLHFEDCNKDLHRGVVARMLRQWLPRYRKAFDYAEVKDGYLDAKRRTEIINARSEIVKQIQNPPFCSVCPLVDQILNQPGGPRNTELN
jgi:hypothetical protein